MAKRLMLILAVGWLFLLAGGGVWGSEYDLRKHFKAGILDSGGLPDYLTSSRPSGLSEATIQSPYDVVLGYTYWDYQHHLRMPRMVASDYQTCRGLHFTFMELEEPPGNRYVDYNYWDSLGWTCPPPPSCRISSGPASAGYTGLDVIRPLTGYFKPHSRAVVCYHTSAAMYPNPEPCYTVLSIEPSLPGQSAMEGGHYWYDIPDAFPGSEWHGMWAAAAVDSLNRIHVVIFEADPSPGVVRLGYTRCEELPAGDSLMCCAPGGECVRLAKETFYTDQDHEVAVFGQSGTVTQIVITSKISNKVALLWTDQAETLEDSSWLWSCGDVFFVESPSGGDDWFTAGSMPARVNVTNYQPDDPLRAYGEISGVYDFDDSLHVFWIAQGYDQANNRLNPDQVVLFHWSKATERICNGDPYVANEVHSVFCKIRGCQEWIRTKAKVQCGVGIVDSTVDPGHYNRSYLYVHWTQFNEDTYDDDEKAPQGDLYVTLSTDGGFTWQSAVNVTNSTVDHCEAGQCASDHCCSIAERVDTAVYMQWIYDLDVGFYPTPDGVATNNPVLFRAFPTDSIPILSEARIAWSPSGWTTTPINIPVGGTDTVYLTLENSGTDDLSINSMSTTSGWLSIGSYPGTIQAGGCPAEVALTVTGTGSCSFKVGSIRVQSNDQVGNNDIDIPIHVVEDNNFAASDFEVVDNHLHYLSVSNTGNLGHQNDTAGMYLYTDQAEPEANFIFDGSPAIGYIVPGDAVPASAQNDTLVGRYLFDNHYVKPAGALDVDTISGLKTIRASGEFWPIRIQVPPEDQYWPWWKGQIQEHVMYSADSTHKFNWNERYMTLVVLKLFHDAPPCWWASITPPASYPTTLLGMVLDIDSPSDSGAWNYPGYNEAQRMAWLQGYGGGVKMNYAFALAQRDTCYEYDTDKFKCWPNPGTLAQRDEPYAMHLLRNDAFVFPEHGFRDDSLYKHMNTAGYSIYGDGIEEDYSIVNTGAVIETHSLDDTFEVRYGMVVSDKQFAKGRGMADKMDSLVASIMCGNADRDMDVSLADIVYLISYVLKGGGEPWLYMSDADGNCQVGLSDIVYLIAYMFKGGPPPRCSCSQLR